VNNDVARAAGLLAVAVLPGLAGITPSAYEHPAQLSAGFHNAVLICAGLCAAGGVLSAVLIGRSMPEVGQLRAEDPAAFQPHCPVDGPQVRSAVTVGCRDEDESVGAGGQPVVEGGRGDPGALPR
jgi:hypothetical protein